MQDDRRYSLITNSQKHTFRFGKMYTSVYGCCGFVRNVHLATVEGVYGGGTGRIFYDELQCIGSESSLEQCTSDSFHDCTHTEDAGVVCDSGNHGNGDVNISKWFKYPKI